MLYLREISTAAVIAFLGLSATISMLVWSPDYSEGQIDQQALVAGLTGTLPALTSDTPATH